MSNVFEDVMDEQMNELRQKIGRLEDECGGLQDEIMELKTQRDKAQELVEDLRSEIVKIQIVSKMQG